MAGEEIELRFWAKQRSDEELLKIVGVNAANYRSEAINIAIEELTRRGMPFSSAGQIAEYYGDYPELKGVRGWLLFLCLRFTVITPLFMIASLIWAFSNDQYAASFTQSPKLTVAIISIISAICMIPVLFGIYAGIALWTIKKHAVKLAKVATVVFIALNLFDLCIGILVQAFSTSQSNTAPNWLFSDVTFLGGNIIWFAYLSKSDRVRNTYGNG